MTQQPTCWGLVPFGATALLIALTMSSVDALLHGLPEDKSICRSMKPAYNASTQWTGVSPFVISINKDQYVAGETLQVTLSSTDGRFSSIECFLIEARLADWRLDQIEPIGSFTPASSAFRTVCDGKYGSGLTYDGPKRPSGLELPLVLTWVAPPEPLGHIRFWMTIVLNEKSFVMERSKIVRDPKAKNLSSELALHSIDLSDCGSSKGCYRNPQYCSEPSCDIVVTWKNAVTYTDFELSADTDGWVAVALSQDKRMGNDDVYECVYNAETEKVQMRQSYNDGKKNRVIDNPVSLLSFEGNRSDGRIRCRFRRDKTVPPRANIFDIDARNYYLFLASGPVDGKGNKRRHPLEPEKYPYVSPHEVNLRSHLEDLSGRARYFIIKIHGCLMIFAWMGCAGVAVIMAKYYKPMWPNDQLCKERIWFAVHRGCLLATLFCTTAAFILIFINTWGYSELPDLPEKAHPILGIITTALLVLNPLIAACRPSPLAKHRPIFNWFHWLIGTCAFAAASPTIFIGLNIPKAHVPWWATWVMVAFMLFHLIIELLLEMHGCFNGPKQKMRDEETFLKDKKVLDRSDEYYSKQEPVGYHFKRRVMGVYVTVTVLLCAVMIIAIAIG